MPRETSPTRKVSRDSKSNKFVEIRETIKRLDRASERIQEARRKIKGK